MFIYKALLIFCKLKKYLRDITHNYYAHKFKFFY